MKDENIKRWAKYAKSKKILRMTEAEVVVFAKRNKFAIYNVSGYGLVEDSLVGWRLYETHEAGIDPPRKDFPREVGELYYVVEKIDVKKSN